MATAGELANLSSPQQHYTKALDTRIHELEMLVASQESSSLQLAKSILQLMESLVVKHVGAWASDLCEVDWISKLAPPTHSNTNTNTDPNKKGANDVWFEEQPTDYDALAREQGGCLTLAQEKQSLQDAFHLIRNKCGSVVEADDLETVLGCVIRVLRAALRMV